MLKVRIFFRLGAVYRSPLPAIVCRLLVLIRHELGKV